MSAVTPSIVQQRIILIICSVVIAVVVWWQDTGSTSDYPVQKFSQTPVPDDFDTLDFTSAEAGWSSLDVDTQGNLQIDALTETALLDALALMSDRASELRMSRMAFLLEKQFGVPASQQIMQLLPLLKNYKEAEQRWWEQNGGKNPPPHAELFQLQDELLGETLATKMFAQQRQLLNVMLASQQIRENESLTEAEKNQALMELQKSVQEDASVE